MAVNESLFPQLSQTGFRITSPPDAVYNCIAWAAGVVDAWWWPDPDGFDFWPNVVLTLRVRTYHHAERDGYIIFRWSPKNGVPMHAARQLATGRWTSKLGPDDDIEHDLDGLTGLTYGTVVLILRRPVGSS